MVHELADRLVGPPGQLISNDKYDKVGTLLKNSVYASRLFHAAALALVELPGQTMHNDSQEEL